MRPAPPLRKSHHRSTNSHSRYLTTLCQSNKNTTYKHTSNKTTLPPTITIMFALRQRLLGPATTSVAKRSFRSGLLQQPHPGACVSLLATERLPHDTTATARRTISTTINNYDESSLGGVFAAASNTNHGNSIPTAAVATTATTTTASLPSLAVAMVSNWFVSAWNHDGLFLISTLKRRRKMMNKHKLRKRRKKNRMKNKK